MAHSNTSPTKQYMTIEELENTVCLTPCSTPIYGSKEDVLEAAENPEQVRAVVIGHDSLFQRESQLAGFFEPYKTMPFFPQRRAHVQSCMHRERMTGCVECDLFRGSSSSHSHCCICLLSETQVCEVQSRTKGETVAVRVGHKEGYFKMAWMPYSERSGTYSSIEDDSGSGVTDSGNRCA